MSMKRVPFTTRPASTSMHGMTRLKCTAAQASAASEPHGCAAARDRIASATGSGRRTRLATKDEQFKMPDGSVYIVRRPAADSDGAFVEMEFVLPPGCVPPPPHV